jgi:dipeptidase E
MDKMVLIGGGEIGRPGTKVETTKLDRETIKLTEKKHPKLLFIPTASSDSEGYMEVVEKHFGKRLGCKVDSLLLFRNKYSRAEISKRILKSDIIYVGGGNTLKMMKRWRRLGVDNILRKAFRKGIVFSGLSAGAICWFDSGHSDSLSFYGNKKWDYINVKGIGLVKGIHCPHFDSGKKGKLRKNSFRKFMLKYSKMGIGLDEKCALIIFGKKYRVIGINKRNKAYKVYRFKGKAIVKEIEKSKKYKPIGELYKKL